MTPAELKSAAAVMLAAAEGKQIQVRIEGTSSWLDTQPSWNWDINEYRVKPEPREFYAQLYDQSGLVGGLYETKAEAERHADRSQHEVIKVREVLP